MGYGGAASIGRAGDALRALVLSGDAAALWWLLLITISVVPVITLIIIRKSSAIVTLPCVQVVPLRLAHALVEPLIVPELLAVETLGKAHSFHGDTIHFPPN